MQCMSDISLESAYRCSPVSRAAPMVRWANAVSGDRGAGSHSCQTETPAAWVANLTWGCRPGRHRVDGWLARNSARRHR